MPNENLIAVREEIGASGEQKQEVTVEVLEIRRRCQWLLLIHELLQNELGLKCVRKRLFVLLCYGEQQRGNSSGVIDIHPSA